MDLTGKVSAAGEQVSGSAAPLTRRWRPTLRVPRNIPRPGEPAEENVSLLLDEWFIGVPVPEHDVAVTGKWHEEDTGGYLEVEVYADLTTGATFSRRGSTSSPVTVEGVIDEWRDLTITGQDTAFAFTLLVGPTQARSIAFRGPAKPGTRGLNDGVRVHIEGEQTAGGVIVPRIITFPNDPRMPAWKGSRVISTTLVLILVWVLALPFAAIPAVLLGEWRPSPSRRGPPPGV